MRTLIHAREWIPVFAFIGIVVASFAVSLYVVVRWVTPGAGAVEAGAPGFWYSIPVRAAAVAILALGLLAVGWGRFVEPNLLGVTRVEIGTEKLSREDARPPRLVFLSDLHVEGLPSRLRRLSAVVRGLAPDAVLLGGDYLNDQQERSVEVLASAVKALAGIAPVYAVIGNADEPRPLAYRTVAAAGAKVLVNEPVDLAGGQERPGLSGVTVWGLRWLDEEALSEAASRLDPERVNVCLTHAPGMIPQAARAGFDLYLAGHTHGGQVRLPALGALVTLAVHGKRFECGRYPLPGGMTAYVTRGVGLEGGSATRVRFMCRPEVVLVEFVPEA